ncbi:MULTISPECIES: hypothetical protein [Sphingobium]|uniref:hypothetical protein n=1 Tax=Sphingobium TaxID=165695 RepID=UPI0015EC2FF9|nr:MULTISPECIES: hypothetical protein [Sphingobium]MCW2363518.1 hypothetical protein [Sphingobium sp. B10D3B]MCW2383347.1 hypothetical protein [Sphingobium sp. B2D3B]MCW2403083.1 hypothetical protein [Sphingobium sp. B10D7B]MCW2410062.1 hypothetical protein [Sphingobium xanthum]
MTFSRVDQETIRAIVREEIALDELNRLEAPTSPTIKSAQLTLRGGAGAPPTVPAPTTIAKAAEFVAALLREERDRRCDIEAVTVHHRGRGTEVRLIAGGRSFTLTVNERQVMA